MASPTIRMLWGIAKSPELGMTDEELHLLVLSHTGKDSIKQLNKRELGMMVSVLADMKDSAKGAKNRKRQTGNPATVNQRKKVYKLAESLGWTKKARINGFCRKMFGVECGLAELHAVFRPDRSFEEHGGKDGKRGWKITRNC